jgi:hypothetical protein
MSHDDLPLFQEPAEAQAEAAALPYRLEVRPPVTPRVLAEANKREGRKGAWRFEPRDIALQRIKQTKTASGSRLNAWILHPDEAVPLALIDAYDKLPVSAMREFRARAMADAERENVIWTPMLATCLRRMSHHDYAYVNNEWRPLPGTPAARLSEITAWAAQQDDPNAIRPLLQDAVAGDAVTMSAKAIDVEAAGALLGSGRTSSLITNPNLSPGVCDFLLDWALKRVHVPAAREVLLLLAPPDEWPSHMMSVFRTLIAEGGSAKAAALRVALDVRRRGLTDDELADAVTQAGPYLLSRIVAHPGAGKRVWALALQHGKDREIRTALAENARAVADPDVRAALANSSAPAILCGLLAVESADNTRILRRLVKRDPIAALEAAKRPIPAVPPADQDQAMSEACRQLALTDPAHLLRLLDNAAHEAWRTVDRIDTLRDCLERLQASHPTEVRQALLGEYLPGLQPLMDKAFPDKAARLRVAFQHEIGVSPGSAALVTVSPGESELKMGLSTVDNFLAAVKSMCDKEPAALAHIFQQPIPADWVAAVGPEHWQGLIDGCTGPDNYRVGRAMLAIPQARLDPAIRAAARKAGRGEIILEMIDLFDDSELGDLVRCLAVGNPHQLFVLLSSLGSVNWDRVIVAGDVLPVFCNAYSGSLAKRLLETAPALCSDPQIQGLVAETQHPRVIMVMFSQARTQEEARRWFRTLVECDPGTALSAVERGQPGCSLLATADLAPLLTSARSDIRQRAILAVPKLRRGVNPAPAEPRVQQM